MTRKKNQLGIVWVAIPTWNRKDDLLECLASIQASKYPNINVIVFDNNSEDDSVEAVRRKFPEVFVIAFNKNMGTAFAANRAFEMAIEKGADYLLRLDNDVVVHKEMISKLVAAIEQLPNAGIVFPKILRYDNPDIIWYTGAKSHPLLLVNRMTNYNVKDHNNQEISKVDYAPVAVALMTRELFQKTGGFDEVYFTYFDDFDLCLKSNRLGYNIYFIPEAEALHKIGSDKLSTWGVKQFYRGKMLFYIRNTRSLHKLFLIIYSFIYVVYRGIFFSEPILPAFKGLISALRYPDRVIYNI